MNHGSTTGTSTESTGTVPSISTVSDTLGLQGGLRMFRPMMQNLSQFAYAFDTDGILRNTHSGDTLSMKVTFTGASLRRQEMIRAMCIRDVRQRLFALNMTSSQISIPGYPTSCIRVLHSENLFTHRGPVLLVLQGGAMSQAGVWATRLLLHPQNGLRSGSQIDLVRRAHESGYAVALIHGGDYGPSEAELDAIELISVLSRPVPPTNECEVPLVTMTTHVADPERNSNLTSVDSVDSVSTHPLSSGVSLSVPSLDASVTSATGIIHHGFGPLRSASSSALFSLLLNNLNASEDNVSKHSVNPTNLIGCRSDIEQPSSSGESCKADNPSNIDPSLSIKTAIPCYGKPNTTHVSTTVPFAGSTNQLSHQTPNGDNTKLNFNLSPRCTAQPDLLTSAGLVRRTPVYNENPRTTTEPPLHLPATGDDSERLGDISVIDQIYGVWRHLVPRLLSEKIVIWAHREGGVGLVHPLQPMPGIFDGFPECRNQLENHRPSVAVNVSVPSPNGAPYNAPQQNFSGCHPSALHTVGVPATANFDLSLCNSVGINRPNEPNWMTDCSMVSAPISALQESWAASGLPSTNHIPTPSTSQDPICASSFGKLKLSRKRHMSAGPLLFSSRTRFADRSALSQTCSQHTSSNEIQTGSQVAGILQVNKRNASLNNKPVLLEKSSLDSPSSCSAFSSSAMPHHFNLSEKAGATKTCARFLTSIDESATLRVRLAKAWQKKARRLQDELTTRVKGIVFTECPAVLNLAIGGVGWGTQLLAENTTEKPPFGPLRLFTQFGSHLPPRVLEARKWLSENSVHYVASDTPIGTKLNSPLNGEYRIPLLSAGTTEHDLIPSIIQDAAFEFFQKRLNAAGHEVDDRTVSVDPCSGNRVCPSVSIDTNT